MSPSSPVSIAGAGVFGLATALCLAEVGCAVTVWDDGAENASQVAAGMLAPVFEAVLDAEARLHFDLLLAARDLWPDLAARTGVELDRAGAVAVGAEDWLKLTGAGLAGLGVGVQEVGAARLAALSPGLSPGFAGGLMVAEDWRLDPLSALAGLRGAAAARGVVFRDQRLAASPAGSILVVATGAANDLAPELAQLTPIKGHLARVGAPAVGVVVRGEAGYAVPSNRGMVFGATMEPGLRDPAIVAARAQPVLDQGWTLFPTLRGQPVTLAAGIRAATPDGLPMAGRSSQPDTFLAAGARRNGWLLAPLVAQVVTGCVTGRDSGPYAARMDPARFGE
jgi:glycine oxidase